MTVFNIPIVKGGKDEKGKGVTLPLETDDIEGKYYEAIFEAGAKVVVNGGATGIKKEDFGKEDDPEAMAKFHAAALAKAQERIDGMRVGAEKPLKLGRAAAVKGPSGAHMTEARRIARQAVKDLMRQQGLKVTHYKASEITEAANEMLNDPDIGPGLMAMAERNIAERTQSNIKVDLGSKMKADPDLVAAAEKRKAKEKLPAAHILSAAKAGKVQPRATKH